MSGTGSRQPQSTERARETDAGAAQQQADQPLTPKRRPDLDRLEREKLRERKPGGPPLKKGEVKGPQGKAPQADEDEPPVDPE